MPEIGEGASIVDSLLSKKERENFLLGLKKQIDKAYKNRVIHIITPDGKSSLELVKEAKEVTQKIESFSNNDVGEGEIGQEVGPDECINIINFQFQPLSNAAYVSDFKDFPDLIKMSYNKLAEEGMFNKARIQQNCADDIKHEGEHYRAASQHKIANRCGVKFLEDRDTGVVGLVPFLTLSGMVTVEQYSDVINAVSKPSATDKIMGSH